jgi:hypothetical protein
MRCGTSQRMAAVSPACEAGNMTAVRTCPACGAREVVPIVYGYPGRELLADAEAGRVVLGGCILRAGSPTRSCNACGHQWGRLRLPRWATR